MAARQLSRVRLAVVSGYEPFGDYKGNPSARIALALDNGLIEGIRVKGVVLPNVYDSHERLMDYVDKGRRENRLSKEEHIVVVSGGLSSSILKISLEAVGHNEIDSKYADANGVLVNDKRPVVPGAVGAYRTNADLVAVLLDLGKAGVPATISADPGRFTCNSIAFGMWHLIAESKEKILFAFYHTGLHKGDIQGELPPSKIFHPPEWLEIGVPAMVRTLARQADTMIEDGDWSYPIPMDIQQVPTLYYKK